MNKLLNEFLIHFKGLKLGKHDFKYHINNSFFEIFNFKEFENAEIKVDVVLEKKSNFMELNMKHKGFVNVVCDTSGENFDLKIKSTFLIIIQFGEEFNNDNDELLILPHGEHEVDISQFIYEMIVLSVPVKKIHPGIKDRTLQNDVLNKLKDLKIKTIKQEQNLDPRWDKLKQFLTIK